MKLLTNKHYKSYKIVKILKKIEDKHAKDKKHIVKLGAIVIIQVNIEVLHITYPI